MPTLIIVVLITVIIFDGVRRVRKVRKDSIKMSLKPASPLDDDEEDPLGSEFPNGGNVSAHQIDAGRIENPQSLDFGSDLSQVMREKMKQSSSQNEIRNERSSSNRTSRAQCQCTGSMLDRALHPSEEIVREVSQEIANEQEQSSFPNSDPLLTNDALSAQDVSQPLPKTAVLDNEDDVAVLERPATSVSSISQTTTRYVPEQTSSVNRRSQQVPVVPRATKRSMSGHQPTTKPDTPDLVLVMHIKAADGAMFHGRDLLDVILSNGLRYGDMKIFHYHQQQEEEDIDGPVLFSMANMVKPGTFELRDFETLKTVGLSFFLSLPVADDANMDAFDTMLSVIERMAEQLKGELKDEYRSALTAQTIAHYRERIKDYSLRQQLKKRKSYYR